MKKRILIFFILAFSMLSSSIYAEPNTDIINEVVNSPDNEVISILSSNNYIEELKAMGYFKDDYSDENINLRNAVLRFQSDCNLPADGIQGPMFKSAMLKRLDLGSKFRSPDIIRSTPSKGFWITINSTNRILTLYRGKTIVKKYPVAIGKETDKTP
ncbi:MAG: L,D-transpeptidase family protein, partial [Pseudomonadota bacterium]